MRTPHRSTKGLAESESARVTSSRNLLPFLLLFPLIVNGCSTFNQRFYVASTDGDVCNYYRTTVEGWTFLSSSEFQTGAAPTEIVDRLLGQTESVLFAEPSTELAQAALTASRTRAEERRTEPQTKLIDPFTGREMPDQKIVISLSSDPDAIFQALQGAVASEEVSKALQSIILGQRSARLVRLRSDARRHRLEIQKVIDQLKDGRAAAAPDIDQDALIVLLQRFVVLLE